MIVLRPTAPKVLSITNPVLRGKVAANCSAVSFSQKVTWWRQGNAAERPAAASTFVGKVVAGAAEAHGRMQQDAATGSFFNRGRIGHVTPRCP